MNDLIEDPKYVYRSEKPGRVAFVQACWHKEIVDQCRDTFLEGMVSHGYPMGHVDVFEVPGAFEIPLHAKRLAASERYEAIVASAFVVNGGIYRHEFVSSAVIDGLMKVQIDTDIPIFSAVLTPHNFHESEEHFQFFQQHFRLKGREVANACADTIRKLNAIRTLQR